MTKVTLNDLTNLNNQTSSINTINGNNTTIETAFDNTLSRDGSTPNQMEANLDMNSNHIINLPEPAGEHEPLRLGDITNFIDQFALVQTPSPGDAGKIIRVRADEIAYDISSTIVDATTNNVYPVVNDTGSLGTTSNKWSDLFLASGAVINFNSGDVTLTHSTDNLAFAGGTYQFDGKIYPTSNDGASLGDTTHNFSDLFLATGAVINFNNGDVTITHASNNLLFAGASTGYTFDAVIYPTTNDGAALGTSTLKFSDLFLASGAVINFNAGDVTITHAADNLLFAGAASGYTFDAKLYPTTSDGAALGDTTHMFSDLFLASGGVINFNNGDVTITHSSNVLAFAGASTNYTFDANVNPATSDGAALGTSSLMWSDLFLASGAVINFNASDVTITHSADQLTIAGLGAYTVGSTGGLQVNQDIVSTSGAIYALGGAIPTSTSVPGVYFGKESANTNRAIQIVVPSSGSAYIDFAPVSVDFAGRILYDTSANTFSWSINGQAETILSATSFSPAVSDGNALGTSSLMWSDLFLASGAVINFNNGDVTLTHASDTLTFAGAASGYKFDATVMPTVSDGAALGTSSLMFSDLFLASGAVVNFNAGDFTLTHSSGILTANKDIQITTAGTASASAVTVGATQTLTNKTLTSAKITTNLSPTTSDGAALGSTSLMFSDLFLASGAVINFNNSDLTLTHSSGKLTNSGSLEVQKAVQFSGIITAALTADTNDWAPTGNATASTFLVTATSGWNLTGIAGGTAGRLLLIFNTDVANTFTIKANNTNSSAANRIQCGTDLNLAPGTGALLCYETTNNFWRLIGGGSGGGGVSNAYGSMTDGTTTANASGSDTFKFRASTGLTNVVGSNDVTHGDNLLTSLAINALTQDTSPDRQADYALTYDSSASAHKKVLLKDIVYPQCTVQVFTSSGTWSRPTGCRSIKATIVGGGAGGGGGGASTPGAAGAGGGSGATVYTWLDVTSTSSLTVTVGSGGSAGSSSGGDGGSGGNSGLGTSNANGLAGGGDGGDGSTSNTTSVQGGSGGTASNGTININGSDGDCAVGGSASGNCAGGTGGTSSLGGAGSGSSSGTGGAANGYGSGGGGGVRTTSAHGGGSGKAGIVIIEEFY